MPTLNGTVASSFKALLAGGGEKAERVLAALRALGDGARSLDSIAEAVSAEEGAEDLGAVVAGLVRLASGQLSKEKVLEELLQSVESSRQFEPAEAAQLSEFFRTLFELAVVDGAASYSLASEYERLFSGAVVLSDIRPIPTSSTNLKITSFVLMHQLKIRYEDIEGPGELYVALTGKELRLLTKQLQDAIGREENILGALGGAFGKQITPGED